MNPGFGVTQCLILADPRDPSRQAVIEKAVLDLVSELKRVGIGSRVSLSSEPPDLGRDKVDLIIVMGGDGAMIHFAGKLGRLGVPFYGLNYGNVGFMMNNPAYGSRHHAEKLKAGDFATRRFPVLYVKSTDLRGNTHEGYGLNDIYLQRMTAQSCKADIALNGVPLPINPILCDGLIVATPLGSTAYSYNITGSLVAINTDILTLTPIAAHRSCRISSMILPQNTVFDFEILEPEKRRVQVVSDGQSHGNLVHASVRLSEKWVSLCFDRRDSQTLAMRFINKACEK